MSMKPMRVREPNAVQRWWRETQGELRRVSWPTRTEAINLTRIVIIVMIISAAFLGGLDILFENAFLRLLGG